MTATCRF